MASQPTSGQAVDSPVKWTLAVGMFVVIGLLVAVASGILSQGTDTGAAPEPTTSEPTASESTTSEPSIPSALVGRWREKATNTDLTLASDGTATLTTSDGQVFTGHVLPGGADLVLVFADPPTRFRLDIVEADAFVLRGLQGEARFDRVR